MNKPLKPKTHGYLDYLVDATFFLAPSIFGFSEIATTLAYIVASVHLVMNLMTRYPLGLVKVVPFPVHGAVEFVASILLVLAPNLFSFTEDVNATWFYRISGAAIFGVWALTDYRAGSLTRASDRPILRAARPRSFAAATAGTAVAARYSRSFTSYIFPLTLAG